MSELIDNARKRKDLLKHMILQLHKGEAPEQVKGRLKRLLGEVPYGEVVQVEQELIEEGLPAEEVMQLCDVHAEALKGSIDTSGARDVLPGHPVHTFQEENRALTRELSILDGLFEEIAALSDAEHVGELLDRVRQRFNNLMDVDKHYRRKENLLFSFLEKHDITGPPKVMWGKHDETRELLKGVQEVFAQSADVGVEEVASLAELVFKPAAKAIADMIYKEEEILLPMSLDVLNDEEWHDIKEQSLEIGFCLFDPKDDWRPEGVAKKPASSGDPNRVQLPSGSFSIPELTAMLNTIPFDMTFVDKDDIVRFFTQGRERIFERNRAILGRQVKLCHPPSSVHVVEKILSGFKSGKQERASFWITLHERFLMIEYFALRDASGNYLGCLEVSQDLTAKRALSGERRILEYE